MADQPDNELSLPKTDAGTLFRLEMWATNVFLGYWWVLVVAIVAILAGVAIYGFWDSQQTATQRGLASRTEAALRKVDAQLIDHAAVREQYDTRGARVLWSPSFDNQEPRIPPIVTVPLEVMLAEFGLEGVDPEPVLIEVADELMVVARDGGASAGGAHAALIAAELYRLANQAEPRAAALEKARKARGRPQRFSAELALAKLAFSSGDLAGGESILRPWITESNGFFGQHAALELARAYRRADRSGDAITTLQELQQLWPTSVFADDIEDELEALGHGSESAPEPELVPDQPVEYLE